MKSALLQLKKLFIPNKDNNYRPRLLESRLLTGLVVFVVILKIVILPFLAYFPKINFFADISKTAIIQLVNQERKDKGLTPLKENPRLDRSAMLKAEDIIKNNYFNHYSPQGKSPWYWFNQSGYRYSVAGENLGIGFIDSKEIYRAWNNSPSHRANLLNPRYREIGIAIVQGEFQGNKTTIVVQHFGSPIMVSNKTSLNPNSSLNLPTSGKSPAAEKPKTEKTALAEKQGKNNPKNNSRLEPVIMGGETNNPGQEEGQTKQGFRFKVFKFLSLDYPGLIQKIMLGCLAFILISLLINILVEIKVQHKDLIGKTISLTVLLLIFIFTNKELFLKLIPHHLGIY